MAKEVLLKQLDLLHRELQATKKLDATTLQSLERVAGDIRGLVEQLRVGQAPDKEASQSIRDQIEQIEAENPFATQLLSQLTDFLALVGI